MGIARLLAKGWIIFCLYAAAHAVRLALLQGQPLDAALPGIGICALLFIAMGLLFVGGFGVSASHYTHAPWLQRFKPHHLIPGFNEAVFFIFVMLSFLNQALVAPGNMERDAMMALQRAIYFVVPGQRALVAALDSCTMDGGRIFSAAFAWLLAIIYLASAASRLKLQAGLIRLEAGDRPQILGPTLRAFLFGIAAVVGIQFLFVGSAYPWLHCSAFANVTGALLIGLAPLMLAYLIVAALASLMASAPEK
ncbi:MAG TPA: hypothetical protein VFI23_13330 [Rhizomicrobium sp.]|nr:hypothetical protein [Rhizomicrobium sp.]